MTKMTYLWYNVDRPTDMYESVDKTQLCILRFLDHPIDVTARQDSH